MNWILFAQAMAPEPLLMQPVRQRLMGIIRRRPGLAATELRREVGEAWGTVQYHLALLQESHMVTTVEAGRGRLFFADGVDPQRARLIGALHQGRRQEIAHFIRDHPGVRQVDLCHAVSVSRKTLRASISALVEAGLVLEHKSLRENRYFAQEPLEELLRDDVA